MNAIILACTSLEEFIEQAQRNAGTNYPIWRLDKSFHRDPKLMRQQILKALAEIPEEYDTILVAMGYCGGSWEDVPAERKIVIPRVDDCISVLMTVDDMYIPNRKSEGSLYIKDENPASISFRSIFENYTRDMDPEAADEIHQSWKNTYSGMKVIDTGLYECHTGNYMKSVYDDADWLEAGVEYVPGGVLLLEKLVSGKWDEQFAVIEPGEKITSKRYF